MVMQRTKKKREGIEIWMTKGHKSNVKIVAVDNNNFLMR